ncbi:Hypothetical predicted protein [Pelobates cultripes]|uniref:Uncharacterized protein n=1 Tax=Pelobates cultripes TaxID=61616 RepID=A0AAD1R503_PELCU|nr:Hypothetical predicted protein [Pelobates cultripes]
MGKCLKKLKTQAGDGHQSIRELFHMRPKPKMAAPPANQDSSSESEELLDAPDPIPEAAQSTPHTLTGDRGALATKGDIIDLMVQLWSFFRADLVVVQEEVTAVTAAEENITSLSQAQAGTSEHVRQIQTSLEDVQKRLNAMDDTCTRKNLKVRGVAESVTPEELPHYFRCLFAALLPHKHTKQALADGIHDSLNPRGRRLSS